MINTGEGREKEEEGGYLIYSYIKYSNFYLNLTVMML